MKNKTKVVVALGSLLAVTSGIGAYSTFAWFTTTRTATVNVTSATVYSNYGKLLVSYADTQPAQGVAYSTTSGTVTDGVTPVTGISSSINNATDISGSGKVGEFYKPTWVPGEETTGASAIPSVVNNLAIGTSTPATTDAYYIAFNLEFHNTGTVAINVYFNSTTALSVPAADTDPAQITKDNAAISATRVAVYSTTSADHAVPDAQQSVWQQAADDGHYNYIAAKSGSTLYNVDGYESADASAGAKWHQGAFAAVTKGFTAAAGQLLCNVPATSSVILQFTSWIEGTATGATNTAIGGHVQLGLNFAALEA